MRLCALLWQKPGRKGPNAKGSKAPAQATQFLHHLHVLLLLPIVLYGALIIIQSDSRYQSVYSYRTALIGATIRETFAASARRGTCCSTQPRPSSGARARRCLRRHRPCRCCAAARARRGYAAALLASSGCAAARARRCCRRRIPCTVCATGHGDRAWV
jgi:hypothetical protein